MNLYTRLRALLPLPPLQLARVLAVNTDGTCLVEYVVGPAVSSYAPGLSTGATVLVRGSAAVDDNVFIRNGVIESTAPAGVAYDLVVGEVAALPFGPDRLALGAALAPAAGVVGTPYAFDASAGWTGGYTPRTYSLAAGTLPAGVVIVPESGLGGTPTAAGTATGLVLACTDTTHRQVLSAPFSLTVA